MILMQNYTIFKYCIHEADLLSIEYRKLDWGSIRNTCLFFSKPHATQRLDYSL